MAVDVNLSGGKFEVGQPKKLFTKSINYSGAVVGPRYDVSNDNQRILMNISLNQRSDDNIIIVQNWLKELEEK
ncbi:MAG: hypothetical protein DWP97_12595 [Calditrichaeota bacterium]|nr:MAG: hypothetical protein DWP97_12595 [Calditrichota bacterium]